MKALPLEPLLEASKMPLRQFLATIGCPYDRMQRAMADGITVEQADTWACRLDMHPVEVYGMDRWLAALGGAA